MSFFYLPFFAALSSLRYLMAIGYPFSSQTGKISAGHGGLMSRKAEFHMRLLMVLGMVVGLSGCMSLEHVKYEGSVQLTTEKSGSLQLVHLDMRTLDEALAPDAYVASVSYATVIAAHFDAYERRVFAESLASELTRLHILNVPRVAESYDATQDVNIQIVFTEVKFIPASLIRFAETQVKAAMQIRAGGKKLLREYSLSSADDVSAFTRSWDDAGDTKERVATRLLGMMVNDIQTTLLLESSTASTND